MILTTFPFKMGRYLYQKRYDLITSIFEDGEMELKDYLKFVDYFESKPIKQMFTVNLN